MFSFFYNEYMFLLSVKKKKSVENLYSQVHVLESKEIAAEKVRAMCLNSQVGKGGSAGTELAPSPASFHTDLER